MKIVRLMLGVLLACGACAVTYAEKKVDLKPGDAAPAHLGMSLDGKPVLVTDFPGKAVVVSYWATWCQFCIKEMAMLNAIQTAASDRVQVVTVNIEPKSVFWNVAKRLNKFEVLLLYDPDRKGRRAYGVEGIPHMIIVGKDGKIETINIGYAEDELGEIVDSVNRAIGAVAPT
jgi:thiol-disulfide isomerase/thioredoxin